MFTFIALVVAVIALVVARRALNELRVLRRIVADEIAKNEMARSAAPIAETPRDTVPEASPAPVAEPIRPSEPPIPIYQPPPPVATQAADVRDEVPAPDRIAPAAREIAEPALPPPPRPPQPAAPPPSRPPFWQQIDWESFVGVKLFSWVAGVALVVAAVYFLKYSVDHGWISPPVRAGIGLLTGSALLVICELRVARDYRFTANAMHGAGIAILYATLFAVHALWHLLPPAAVFGGMLVVTAVAVALSLRRDSLFIALLGMMGGFATPALLSTGENRPISLFSYLLLLNAGLAWVAYKKRWPALTAGTILFSAIYQWAWLAKFLDAAQLPLAAGIFAVFALVAASALWMGRRDDGRQSSFDRLGQIGVALPLLFALFAAAVPAYGARYNVLFGFLLLIAAGLGVIATLRGVEWLHALGAIATNLTFVLWLTVSYTAEAWPLILAWVGAFVLLYLGIGLKNRSPVVVGGAAILFVLPALVRLEPRTASPELLFAVLFGLLLLTGLYAVRFERGPVFLTASVFAVLAEALWSGRYLNAERLYRGMTVYLAFGLLYLSIPLLAQRFRRVVRPAAGVLAPVFAAHVFLIFVAASRSLAFPPWPFLLVLFVLDMAIGIAAISLRRGSLLILAVILSQVVIHAWTLNTVTAPWPNTALALAVVIAAMACGFYGVARVREIGLQPFTGAAVAALLLGHGVAISAGASAASPLFGTLLATHALLAIATLVLAAVSGTHLLAVISVPFTALATLSAVGSLEPGQAFPFALVLYVLYVAYPLILGARAGRSMGPYLAPVLASVPFFFVAREAITDAGLGHAIGVLPVGQALVMLLLVVRLLRTENPEERMLTRLAIVAATALAFLTAAVPLQLEKQWVTIAWALEGAALVWLYRRIEHRGLLAWAAALLAVVFVRLTINPSILSYHPPSSTAILNWYLYTYLVCALAFFVAAYLAPDEFRKAAGACQAAGTLLLFLLLNIEIADFYSRGPVLTFNFLSSSLAQDLTYTIGWASFAIALLIVGIAVHSRAARVAAIALLVITIFKCFLHDLARLGGLYRIASFLGLALALVLVSVLLQKFVLSRRPTQEAAS